MMSILRSRPTDEMRAVSVALKTTYKLSTEERSNSVQQEMSSKAHQAVQEHRGRGTVSCREVAPDVNLAPAERRFVIPKLLYV
jgi:hypothetical protein